MFFNEIVSYLTDGNLVSEDQLDLFSELSSVFVEFPIDNEPPSSAVVALAANCGAELPNALASGLNCITDQHLPIQQIAEFISKNYKREPREVFPSSSGKKILGFGHPSIKGKDPRVLFLRDKFNHLFSDHTNFCISLEKHMPVPMNIGCIIASLSLDNGIKPRDCLFLPLLGRSLGWLKLYNKTKTKFSKVVPSFENIKNEH
tara:strand:+ start:3159 stop:3767 length:609 start_codon:yes stop_codon:yes gene_type:complete